MKIVTVTDSYNQTHKDVLYIETLSDLDEFAELSNSENEEEIKLALKTDVNEDRWDHLFSHTFGCMATSISLSKITGANSIIGSGVLLEKKLNRIREIIENGTAVIVNTKGGYFPCHDFMDINIIKSDEYVLDKSQWFTIKDNTKIINLENDMVLEQHSMTYMRALDKNYSSIRRLKKFNKQELTEIFKAFKSKGGETAYIYTTGIDVDQMYDYTEALLDAGIKDIRFEFNAGINDNIKKFLKHFIDRKISFTIITDVRDK